MRIDKYVWAMRLFKTRSLASKAVKEGKVLLGDDEVKPGKVLNVGNIVKLKSGPVKRSFKVLEFPKSRVGAKLVADHMIEITSEEDLALLEEINLQKRTNAYLGIKGRPTKKDRRDLVRAWFTDED
jgi:ribosome-associated heat shock protein Hsp15